MRRSFGGGGSGMGGGSGGGGGGMLRNVQRALRTGVGGAPPEPFSPSSNTTTIGTAANSRKPNHYSNKKQSATPNTALTLSSSSSSDSSSSTNPPRAFSSLINLPALSAPTCSSATCGDDAEWECLDASEDEIRARALYEDFIFGNVPSKDEVNFAVSALQQVLKPKHVDEYGVEKSMIYSSSSESEVDWIEPSLTICSNNSRMLEQQNGSDRVYDAFHLLQNEPSVQRMVISLSSDKAVWDAVLNNEVVKELRGSINQGDEQGDNVDEGSPDGSNPVKDILSWVFANAKAKIMQLIDKITELMNGVFHLPNEEKNGGFTMEEKLKTSLFLSVIVLLIVVATRAQSSRP
ncbi:hypothetical protein ABFS83_06G049500 [Erythranthe nasuta]